MKIKEFAEANPAVPGNKGGGLDVVRVDVGSHEIALSIYPENSLPYVVKINGKEYQSLRTVEESGEFFDRVFKKLAEIA